jgi:peptidoglycan/LPS O-acetylase OafA/YrhL
MIFGRQQKSQYIPTLDGWRAMAILGVIICHTAEYFVSEKGLYPSARLYAYMFHGRAGVSVFFCLSGFLICTLLLNEYQASGTISLRGFYIRRAFRILPAYWSYLVVLSLLGISGTLAITRTDLTSCLLFVRNYSRTATWFTSQFWTLAIEEHFYVLLPVLILLGRGRKSLGAILALVVVTTALRYHFERIPEGTGPIQWDADTPMNELFTGALTAMFVQRTRVRAWICHCTIWYSYAVASLGLYSELGSVRVLHVLQPSLLCFLIATTTLRPDTLPARILEWRPFCSIGTLSYGLYVWQQLFLVRGFESSQLPFGPLQRWPFSWAAIALVSIVSFVYMEKPLIKFGRRLADGKPTRRSSIESGLRELRPATPSRLETLARNQD